jgi:hypothetical protein
MWSSRRRALIFLVSPGGWKGPFEDPIPLPNEKQLVTLQDAGAYITKLPTAEHEASEWQAAIATLGGPMTLARIGVMRAPNRHVERGVQSRSQGPSLGQAEAEAGRIGRRSRVAADDFSKFVVFRNISKHYHKSNRNRLSLTACLDFES